MNKEKILHKIKSVYINFSLFILTMLIIEIIAFGFLRASIKREPPAGINNEVELTEHFPAQLRLSWDDIRKQFPRSLPLMAAGKYMTYQYDPAMGFRLDDMFEWYGDRYNPNSFLIVTLGGSTTVKDNWPAYLIKYAKMQGVEQSLVVLNAGLWGYMTFNEKIYLSSWILPMLNELNLKPNIVLSLDGVNDIWTRIMSYFEKENQNAPIWFSHYHDYHQHLDTDLRKLNTISHSSAQVLSVLARNLYDKYIYYIAPIFPYTTMSMIKAFRMFIQQAPSKETIKEISSKNIFSLKEEIEEKIVQAFQSNLLDLFGEVHIRGIQFVAYLQPVLLEKYYPYPVPDTFYYPNFNFEAMNLYRENRLFTRLTGNFVVKTEKIYDKSDMMYNQFNDLYPGHFKSLANIFKDNPAVDTLYSKDAVHYAQIGKELIAKTIINDLIEKNILTIKR
ncbi:MAG: hypothetical protein HQK79_04315 [Desulfobacterales bacterium]|nr:hypothetical protein [Desulfobacterales bacterium]